ncbi:DUF7547 family protein [Natrinema halophilum]|uniref:Uncharacterized protein n=1 Tax=Natrinema halophilum TaxID=1699371 RepID=A0A7D5H4V6_9EURY|nr:hypothetical protein [Natrinema halophilum]QLG47595.1 MSCRAMM family adhesin SdrC [Natrinema halophilum]
MADHDDELVDAVRELTRTIDALRTELEESSARRRPPLRPPTPGEVLRFTDEIALPAVIAVLETSVRALEAFQRSLKLVQGGREARNRTSAAAEATSDRTSELRRTTLSQLDTVLSELQRAASTGGLPADEQARDLLAEARELRDDVDRRLRDVAEGETEAVDSTPSASDRGVEIDIENGPLADVGTNADSENAETERTSDDRDSAVDVDAELETLRDRYGSDEDATADSNESDEDERNVDDSDPKVDRTESEGADTDDEAYGGENSGDEPDR